MFGSEWRLCVSPVGGWEPVWAAPVYAAVVIIALISSALLLFMLSNRRQHYDLLTKMLPPKVVASLNQ